MAFSFRAGTNWCHDFPKLARESGFYFNLHRNRVRVDWNRISTIDIDRVIQDRDFFTIDDNINNVVDYYLETEYDVKILDPNFVKLFRLAQLSVEYLLYCKQYLDHSVIILKDELRLKLEENVRLKKELLTSENNIKELKEKFRDRYKFIEKRFSDSHGEIHKCPFCPKTFIADVFMNSHITRRHSDASQLSVTSPVHEQYKAETEKLHHEIKTLKERLNETERVIRSESIKPYDSIELNEDKYIDDTKSSELKENDNLIRNKKLEKENKKYLDEMSHLTTMLFSEIRSLKQDEKKTNNQYELENENVKELLKIQENEIHRLRDQLRQLSTQKTTLDMETIQAQLNAQQAYWQSKIERIESQHHRDIETLYEQFKITQASADFFKADYITKVKEFERLRHDNQKESSTLSPLSVGEFEKIKEHDVKCPVEVINTRGIRTKVETHSEINRDKCEDVNNIPDTNMVTTTASMNKSQRTTSSTKGFNESPQKIFIKKDRPRNLDRSKIHCDSSQNLSNQPRKTNDICSNVNVKTLHKLNDQENDTLNTINNHRENILNVVKGNKMDVSSSESDENSSQSETISESKTSESNKSKEANSDNYSNSADEETITEISEDNTQVMKNIRLKCNEELRIKIQEALEQKLRDLGVDHEWNQIPKATYRQLMNTVEYHRSINTKKYTKFENIRRKIVRQLAQKISIHTNEKENSHLGNSTASKNKPIDKFLTNVKSKAFKALSMQSYRNSHTPKLISQFTPLHGKSITNKLDIELLPKKVDQMKFHEIKSTIVRQQPQSQKLRMECNDKVSPLSPIRDNRYTPSPSELKQLSYSHEDIKDYMKDSSYDLKREINSSLNPSGPITTSTPQRDCINVSSIHKITNGELSSQTLNSEKFMNSLSLPKNNKSVLKSMTGSTGSLVKKKVLFDLEKNESSSDEIIELSSDIDTDEVKLDDEVNKSDSEISIISMEQSNKLQMNTPISSDNIVLKTSQNEKVAALSRKIESQLSSIRQKPPFGGIKTIFTKELNMENDKTFQRKMNNASMGFTIEDVQELGINTQVAKLPKPTICHTPKLPTPAISSEHKSDMNDSNLDMDIEDLLRQD